MCEQTRNLDRRRLALQEARELLAMDPVHVAHVTTVAACKKGETDKYLKGGVTRT